MFTWINIGLVCAFALGQTSAQTTPSTTTTTESTAFNGFIEVQRSFDFEDALTDQQTNMSVWRSEASGKRVLRLEDPNQAYSIEFTICIQPLDTGHNVRLAVDDIRYSNDGPPDTVLVRFNGAYYTYFYTTEKWRSGYEWNVFRNSGRLGRRLRLAQGTYTLAVSVVTDSYGVELDRIRLNAENQDPSVDLFCGATVIGPATA